MSCSGARRKSRSHQKAKRKGGKPRTTSYIVRRQMDLDNIAKAKAILGDHWKPKQANV